MSHKHSNTEERAKIAGIAGLAALAGAAAGLLCAPHTGKQTRDRLNNRVKTAVKQVEDKVAPVIEEPTVTKRPAPRATTARRTAATKPKTTSTAKAAPRNITTRKPTNSSK